MGCAARINNAPMSSDNKIKRFFTHFNLPCIFLVSSSNFFNYYLKNSSQCSCSFCFNLLFNNNNINLIVTPYK